MLQTRTQKIIAVLVIGLVVTAVSLSIWARAKADALEGPTSITQDTRQNIWVLVKQEIYKLNQQGYPLEVIRLSELGINDPLGDIYPHPSGDLIVAIMKTQEIKRFNSEGKLLLSFAIDKIDPDRNYGALKFVLDTETGDYFVADTRNHRIRLFDATGKFQRDLGQKGSLNHQLHFPNRISFGPDGLLYIADTNNHRIMVLNRQGEPQFSIPVVENSKTVRYQWPTHVSFGPHDALTVINRDGLLEDGDIVIVKPRKGVIRRVSLPPDTWPENVLVRQNDFLVTDMEGLRILRISHDGTVQGNFGEGAFKTALSTAFAKRGQFRMIQKFSVRGLILLVCFLFVVLGVNQVITFLKQKKDTAQPTWLDIQYVPIDFITTKRKAAYFMGVVVILIITVFSSVFLMGDDNHLYPRQFLIQVLAPSILGGLALSFLMARGLREGLYRKDQIQRIERALRRNRAVIGQVLMSGEKVRLYTLANHRQGKWATFNRLTLGINMVFLVVTTHRILLFNTDIIGWRFRSIWEVSFHGIRDMSLGTPSKWDRRFFKWYGIGWLSFRLPDADWGIGFVVPLPDQAEALQQAIEAGQEAASPVTFMGIRQICVHCFSSITTPETICPGCHHKIKSPWRAAALSMIYPGLGQLANQGLLKGILFLILNTATLYTLLITLLTWYRGTAEVSPIKIKMALITFLIVWISSVVDAYYTAKRF